MAINNYTESWTDAYDKYKSVINFVAGDFDTLKDAIRRYIVLQNPENYNDWAESSEVGMFANGLSYLGETLHYRVDLNAHDIFPSTTERRQSLLNFAKMLSYSPKRNICALGIAKLTQIQTSQTVYDTSGNLLKDVPIVWNDSSNKNWLEQFLTVMNASFVSTNPYGKPLKKELVDGITTQVYELNNTVNNNATYSFTAPVNGSTQQFEVVNADINSELKVIYERNPMPEQAFHILYRNDGTGNASKNTGFFVYWKQGSLKSEYTNFDQKIENNSYEITTSNINEYDIWVQEVDGDTGLTKTNWTKIANDEYLVYNNTDTTIRTIYKAETRENDTVIIRFSDGKFGTIPVGIFRFWYRVSQGNANLYIKPADIKNVSIRIPYKSNNTTDDNVYYLTLTFSVQDISHIRQSVMQESMEYIRTRSPQVYSTQNRMVTGQDYNYFPKSLGQQIRIVKAIERTYAGNSRYIKFNDPTGTYQDLNMLAEDGYIYQDNIMYNNDVVDDGVTNAQTIIDNYILPLINSPKFENFYYKNWEPRTIKYTSSDGSSMYMKWYETSETGNNVSYGKFVATNNNTVPYSYLTDTLRLSPGSFLKFSGEKGDVWVKIKSMELTSESSQLDYQICIDDVLEDGYDRITGAYTWELKNSYYPLKTSFNSSVNTTIKNKIENKQTFGIAYNASTSSWRVIDAEDLTSEDKEFETSDWVVKVTYNSPNTWNFNARQVDYVFGSAGKVSFFFNMDEKLNNTDGFYTRDYIKVLQLNSRDDGTLFKEDYYWKPSEIITYADGYVDPREVKVYGYDSDKNASVDNPVQYKEMVGSNTQPLYFFTDESSDMATFNGSVKEVDSMWDENSCYTTKSGIYHCKKACTIYPAGTVLPKDVVVTKRVKTSTGYYIQASQINPVTFLEGTIAKLNGKNIDVVDEGYIGLEPSNEDILMSWDANDKSTHIFDSSEYYTRDGIANLKFIWQHYASMNYIIDPCPTNIIDIYALTNTYYTAVQNWLLNGKKGTFPKLPSAYEMKSMFSEIEKYKMVSDSIVWHPIKYKLLFGNESGSEYRAKFSVIKSDSSTLSDNEIKQRIVEAIDTYFASMEAGEKFFFTQLSTYIHEVLGSNIGTIVIVPQYSNNKFGNLFEISCDEDEILLSSASLDDITIISKITNNNIRIGN